MKVLVIGEKTSQVKTFAETLCGSYRSSKQAKYIYTYTGTWRHPNGKIYTFTFLPLAGHITDLKTRKGYDWGECKPIELVENPSALFFAKRKPYSKILNDNLVGKDEVWLATDPDSEGQNIAYEALQMIEKEVRKRHIPVRRIWNSSLTKQEIIRAFSSTRNWEEKLALAVQGRRLADAWLGFAGTRELTMAARRVARIKVLSVGRVQLPTLRSVVHRDLIIENFKPEKRWKLLADLSTGDSVFSAEHSRGFFTKRDELVTLLQKLGTERRAVTTKIRSTNKNRKPPVPLNTTAAVSLLSKLLKVSAKKALDIMVELYNKKLLSYPRTENTRFSDGFPHKEIISKIGVMEPYSVFKAQIHSTTQVRTNGKKKEAEDHDPIHPTGELKGLTDLDVKTFRAWDILTRYYFSLFMEDMVTKNTTVEVDIAGELFIARGVVVVQEGWHLAHNWSTLRDTLLPDLVANQGLEVKKLYEKSADTKPPSRWTESSLLLEMEKQRIGTKSSRPEIIKKLIERKYILKSRRALVSTTWGRAVIASLEPIWEEIVTPRYTRHVEELMDEVAHGKKSYSDMLSKLRSEYIEYHKKLVQMLPSYQQLLRQLKITSQDSVSSTVSEEANRILVKLLRPEEFSEDSTDIVEQDP